MARYEPLPERYLEKDRPGSRMNRRSSTYACGERRSHCGQALVARIDNPVAILGTDEGPWIAPGLAMLDLGGHGIYGMLWLPELGTYLVIGGPAARDGRAFRL